MAYATELWSARAWKPGESASQTFIVTGANTMAEAAAAPIVPAPGSTFVLDTRIRAQQPEISTPDSPTTYHVVVNFGARGSAGGGTTTGPAENIGLPAECHPQISLSTEQVDVDKDGNPLVNAALQAFRQPFPKRFPSIRVVYKRWESSFDGPRAVAFTGAVNSDQFLLPGYGIVEAGQAFCEGITVISPFTSLDRAVQVQVAFEIRGDGFESRQLNEGAMGYYASGQDRVIGNITNQSGDRVSGPILLNESGIPIDGTLRIEGRTAVAAPRQPKGARFETTPQATFVRYKIYKEMPFSGLTLTP